MEVIKPTLRFQSDRGTLVGGTITILSDADQAVMFGAALSKMIGWAAGDSQSD